MPSASAASADSVGQCPDTGSSTNVGPVPQKLVASSFNAQFLLRTQIGPSSDCPTVKNTVTPHSDTAHFPLLLEEEYEGRA